MKPIDYVNSLYSGASQIQNFQTQREIWPTARMSASPNPSPFPKGAPMELQAIYTYGGASKDLQAFKNETETMALVVLKDGAIRHESYADWGGPNTLWMSHRVSKSFVSAVLGIALDEGLIKSIEQPVNDYVPALGIEGSAYNGVRIKDILQMSSGAGWSEDYSDPNSDMRRFGRVVATGGALNEFPATLKRAREPGAFNRYDFRGRAGGGDAAGGRDRPVDRRLHAGKALASARHGSGWLLDHRFNRHGAGLWRLERHHPRLCQDRRALPAER